MRRRPALTVIERQAEVPAGTVFHFWGRALLVVKTHGTDKAAPVIVEELTGDASLKGQLSIWSLDCVRRVISRSRPV